MDLIEFSQRIPKVELHVHLEGSIRPSTLLQLAERNHIQLPAQDVKGLQEFYRFRNFPHFIEVYVAITGCLRTPEDYRLIAYEFGSDCARQNIRYAEVTFSIETNARMTGLPWQAILAALNQGRAQARADFGVQWQWVLDIVRDLPDTQDIVTDIVLAAQNDGVIALGIGGSEEGFPPELFKRSFERAKLAGVHRVPHAGEIVGPSSVWNAIQQLHAERIGHGVRSIEDPKLVEYLLEHQIALEICPTSNICLGIYPDYAHHPLRKLWDAGLLITVNSDDPPMFNTNLNHEYRLLVEHFGFNYEELQRISLNGLRASFLDPVEKTRLENEFQAEFEQLLQQ
jgi:adenosine deaminase